MSEEKYVILKMQHDLPIVALFLLLSSPVVIILRYISTSVAIVAFVVALGISFVLMMGKPPIYMVLLMIITLLRPLGVQVPLIVVDGYEGKVNFEQWREQ